MAYLVLAHNGYADTATDYVPAASKAEVEAQLPDFGWMQNPGVTVYVVPKGIAPAEYALELAGSVLVGTVDPYPDFVVERGPRGGIRWERA